MKSANSVKMSAAFALVLMVFSVTEGRVMNKCELKAKLDAAQLQEITVMGETITVNSLIARLVCKASTSGFNTSFVKNITVQNNEMNPAQTPPQVASQVPPQTLSSGAPAKVPSSRSPPEVRPSGAPAKVPSSRSPPQVKPSGAPPKVPPKPHEPVPTKGPKGSGHETHQPHLSTAAKVVGHLYGVFQLSDQLACDSGMIPSLNVCNITCSALTDDDITNDIACLKTLTNFMKVKSKDMRLEVKKIVDMMLVKECQSVVPQNYFAECV